MSKARREDQEDSIVLRLARYEHAIHRCGYVGGGIGGLLVLVGLNGNSIINAPLWLRASVITLAIVSGASLGRGYLEFASAKDKTARHQKREKLPDETLADQVLPYPGSAHAFYVTAILMLLAAAVLVIIGAWWPAEEKPADALIQAFI